MERRKLDFLYYLKSPFIAMLLVLFIITVYNQTAVCRVINISSLFYARLKFQDPYFKARLFYNEHFRKDYPKEGPAVLIAVDDEAILKTKKNRQARKELIAKAIETLSEYKPKLIVFDILLPPEDDNRIIVDAIKKADRVIFDYLLQKMKLEEAGEDILEAGFYYGAADFVVISDDNVARTFLCRPIKLHSHYPRQPLFVAVVAAMIYKDIAPKELRIRQEEDKIIYSSGKGEKLIIPLLNIHSEVFINYLYDEKNLPIIPVQKLIEGDFEPDLLKGKIAILTMTAESCKDVHFTPIGKMPGGLIMANIINSLIYEDFLGEVPIKMHILILCFLSTLLALFFYRAGSLHGLIALILIIILSVVISFILFLNNILWSAFDVIVLPSLLYIAILCHKAILWKIERRTVKNK